MSYDDNTRTVSRDIPATIVPYGNQVVIPAGASVTITHRLGGNFTVTWDGGMAQVTGRYADALGEAVETPAVEASTGPLNEEAVWAALKQVFDPEIPVNVVDLGLIYSLQLAPAGEDGKQAITVDMTLTAPGCGMGPAIAQDAKYKIEQIPGVSLADVRIVWDPPWHQDMISEAGKMELGLL